MGDHLGEMRSEYYRKGNREFVSQRYRSYLPVVDSPVAVNGTKDLDLGRPGEEVKTGIVRRRPGRG
jgi:hypothetical protein